MTPELFAQLKIALGDAAKSLAHIGETLWREAMQRNLLYAWADAVLAAILLTATFFSAKAGVCLYREREGEAGVVMYVLSAVLTIVALTLLHTAATRFCCPAISTATDLLRDMK